MKDQYAYLRLLTAQVVRESAFTAFRAQWLWDMTQRQPENQHFINEFNRMPADLRDRVTDRQLMPWEKLTASA